MKYDEEELYVRWLSQKVNTKHDLVFRVMVYPRLGSMMEGHFYRGIYEYDSSNKQLKVIYEAFANYPS